MVRTLVVLINQPYLAVACVSCVQQITGAVGRAIIDDNQLPVAKSLLQDAVNGLCDVQSVVVRGYDNGDVYTDILT